MTALPAGMSNTAGPTMPILPLPRWSALESKCAAAPPTPLASVGMTWPGPPVTLQIIRPRRLVRMRIALAVALGLIALGLFATGCVVGEGQQDDVEAVAQASISCASASNLWIQNDAHPTRWFWFDSAGDTSRQVIEGQWNDPVLAIGKNYRAEFNVTAISGDMAVYLGSEPMQRFTSTGTYSFDFTVDDTGRRRLLFQALRPASGATTMKLGVNQICVTELTDTGSSSGGSTGSSTGGKAMHEGHYLSFAKERNLKTEMIDILDNPGAYTSYQVTVAQRLYDALQAPGVQGFWVPIDWATLDKADGSNDRDGDGIPDDPTFDWSIIDDNLAVAERLKIQLVVEIADRSFDGTSTKAPRVPVPAYFPADMYTFFTAWTGATGYTSRRYQPWVYRRLIRLHKAIGGRYDLHPNFEGLATSETATDNYPDPDYSAAAYEQALITVVTETLPAFPNSRFFFYLNFIRAGAKTDMNKDSRTRIVDAIPHDRLVIGGPDLTPDRPGMPGSVNSFRVFARQNHPELLQLCHAQHVDHNLGDNNLKDNTKRIAFLADIERIRANEAKSTFTGTPAALIEDDIRDASGQRVDLHPDSEVGKPWTLEELFQYGQRNFGCRYHFWHYREEPNSPGNQFYINDTLEVIANHQRF